MYHKSLILSAVALVFTPGADAAITKQAVTKRAASYYSELGGSKTNLCYSFFGDSTTQPIADPRTLKDCVYFEELANTAAVKHHLPLENAKLVKLTGFKVASGVASATAIVRYGRKTMRESFSMQKTGKRLVFTKLLPSFTRSTRSGTLPSLSGHLLPFGMQEPCAGATQRYTDPWFDVANHRDMIAEWEPDLRGAAMTKTQAGVCIEVQTVTPWYPLGLPSDNYDPLPSSMAFSIAGKSYYLGHFDDNAYHSRGYWSLVDEQGHALPGAHLSTGGPWQSDRNWRVYLSLPISVPDSFTWSVKASQRKWGVIANDSMDSLTYDANNLTPDPPSSTPNFGSAPSEQAVPGRDPSEKDLPVDEGERCTSRC